MVNRGPELVALWECLEVHQDHENLLYLTDNETTVQDINKWIGGGAKLSLSKTSDTDILKVEKKQLTDQSETYHGCPLNEETDIRVEMRRMKGEQEKSWSQSTELQAYRTYEKGEEKW